ncbi:LysR family transcriptional regulator [Achromobacter sp. GG226]|uniref:LysR family transcriptional regulator n=1 Tax=Verticiella alkaliphila TaxID=2779529 RepID=UPI001C0AA396|nr:LysR family transcriptional regulator [Verticiella sp. GG226]MBU4611186.1 LysR family transcriptional regulator [Verticiella sp. GG226]
MQWDLDQLRLFVAAAEAGSISGGARRLGKAQSAVSTAISLLEADLSVELFDRSRYRASLTEAGDVLLREAREMLRQADVFDHRAQALAAGEQAKLAIALDEALPYGPIARLLRDFSAAYPQLELTLLNGTAAEVAQYVRQERVQVGVQLMRGALSQAFDQSHLGYLQQGVFVCKGHPLLGLERVSQQDLAKYRQLLMHTDGVDEIAYSPRVWKADSCYSMAEMVADDLGWAILPTSITEYESNSTSLRQLDCPTMALPQLPVRMVWLQGMTLSSAADWMRVRLTTLLADENEGSR